MKNASASVPILILAGGLGTRISEESDFRPKPMVEVGGLPILLHIMRYYYSFGFQDFVICAGYKAAFIKSYFINYQFHVNDVEIDHRKGPNEKWKTVGRNLAQEQWRVRVIDTGMNTQTGCRVFRALDVIRRDTPFEHFGLTYGDGLTDADLLDEFRFHQARKTLGSLLGVRNAARYGELEVGANQMVTSFQEKPSERQGYINGGFFFFRKDFLGYLKDDPSLILEKDPLAKLARDGQLSVYVHGGFWQAMDTLRDKRHLQDLWDSGKAPWLPRELNQLKQAS